MKPISSEWNEKIAHFAKVIRPFLKKYSNNVKAARKWAKRQDRRRDRPWMGFIVAFATNGGVRHWMQQIGPTQERYAWNAIVQLSARQRRQRLIEATNPRRRWKWNKKKKELWYPKKLEACFKEFEKAGGPKGIRKQYRARKTGAERIAYLNKFEGIGDKYARDIPMDSYDTLFRNYIALDWRLKTLLLFAFPKRLNYKDGEEFYRQVAHKLKIDCWTKLALKGGAGIRCRVLWYPQLFQMGVLLVLDAKRPLHVAGGTEPVKARGLFCPGPKSPKTILQ